MIGSLISIKFFISLAIALLLLVGISKGSKCYYKDKETRKISLLYITEPTSNSLAIVAILIPILTATAAYLFTNNPTGNFSFLWLSILLLIIALITSLWVSFSLLSIASENEVVKFSFPQDISYIQGMGITYFALLLAIMFLILFFLFDFSIAYSNYSVDQEINQINLIHPPVKINETKNSVQNTWGSPIEINIDEHLWRYESLDSIYLLKFDNNGRLSCITQKRR